MYIDSPVWKLKQRCPCCKEGFLELCTCDNCKRVIAVCDEVSTIFIDPLNISLERVWENNPKECPFCGMLNKLRVAKDYEIIAIGLTTNEYE